MRTKLFLDVDGVLNALGPDTRMPVNHWTDWRMSMCAGFGIQYSAAMGRAIASLKTETIWLTTWEHSANEWISPLFEWPALPVIERGGWSRLDEYQGWWKGKLLQEYLLERPGPFIWADDDLKYGRDQGATQWLFELDPVEYPHLIICPVAHHGLTRSHILRMQAFISEYSVDDV